MVEASTVRLGFVVLYGLVFLGGLVALARAPSAIRAYSYPLLGVIGMAPVVTLLETAGIGPVAVGAGEVNVLAIVRDLFTYLVVYGGVVGLAGVSRRTALGVIAVALVPIVTTNVAPVLGAGALAVGILVAVTVPYPVLLYLFLVPIWRATGDVSPRRRLLHWKARNLLLFVYGMILLFVFVVFGGIISDPVLVDFLFRYSAFWFQAGLPAFLIYTFVWMDPDEARAIASDLAWFREPSPPGERSGA